MAKGMADKSDAWHYSKTCDLFGWYAWCAACNRGGSVS